MSEVVPTPDADDLPFNDPYRVNLDPGKRLTVTFQPDQRSTTFRLPILAISAHPEMHYRVRVDETVRFDAPYPPTDPDDMTVTFVPCISFNRSLEVVVENLSDSATRNVVVQPIGWEEVQ